MYFITNKHRANSLRFIGQKVHDFTGKFRSIVTKYTKDDPRQIAT